MRVSYTFRLSLEIGLFTFIFSLFGLLFLELWERKSYSMEDEFYDVFQIQERIDLARNDEPELFSENEKMQYYASKELLPEEYQTYQTPGIFKLSQTKQILVGLDEKKQSLYYVVFDLEDEAFQEEEFHHEFGIAILFLATVAFFSSGLIYRMAKRTSAPILHLMEQLNKLDEPSKAIPVLNRSDELGHLSQALHDMLLRMQNLIVREREFTAFSSHELRTPLTIMRGNIDILLEHELADSATLAGRAIARIDSATRRMTGISSSFLWLAREHQDQASEQVNRFRKQDLEKILELNLINLNKEYHDRVEVNIENVDWNLRHNMMTIVVDNLIRNALLHGVGSVFIEAKNNHISVRNSKNGNFCINSEGFSQNDSDIFAEPTKEEFISVNRRGVGMKIVHRICEANGWICSVSNTENEFTIDVEVS